MMTISQALLLGSERSGAAPSPPSPLLDESWLALDWAERRESALLDAAALCGTARCAGTIAAKIPPGPEPAAAETLPYARPVAVSVLRRMIAEEWQAPMREWMELCAKSGAIVPPAMLCSLLERVRTKQDQILLGRIAGERGRWLSRQNPEWSWMIAGHVATAAPAPSLWDTGTPAERLELFVHLRQTDPSMSRSLAGRTWGEEAPEFREQLIDAMRTGADLADEPLLTRALKDKRKDVRTEAQRLLATLGSSTLAVRMRTRAEAILSCNRGFLGRKLEVTLPAAFGDDWAADALDQKPPAGVGEKAHWAQQILSLVPVSHWTARFELEAPKLIDLAAKSSDWSELLIGAWYRAATLHREPAACAELIGPILASKKQPVPGVSVQEAVATLLAGCTDGGRWKTIAANPELFWPALPKLEGQPDAAQSRAILKGLATSMSVGGNPGGSPTAIAAARFIPPDLRSEAARLLTRENGLSKPAEAFLQALDLRASMHDAFPKSIHS